MATWKTDLYDSIARAREAIEATDARRDIKILSLGSFSVPRILVATGRRWTKEEMAIKEGKDKKW